MRLMEWFARWRRWSADTSRPPTRSRWRWLCSPWLWWTTMVLCCLVLRPGAPAAAPARLSQGRVGPLLVLGSATPAASQTINQAASCGVTDLTSCINDWINSFTKNTIADWFQQQVGIFQSYGFLWGTPDSLTYHAQPVQELYQYTLDVVSVFLVFILAVAGFNHMTGRSTAWAETLHQVLFCLIIAWFFQPFIALFVNLGNDFIFGMQLAVGAQPTFPAYGAASNAFMDVIAFIVELVGDLLLALEALVRLALLDLLIALAPLGIICYALPQSRAWGKMWAEAFAATILIQPIQATLVMLGAKMISLVGVLISPTATLPPIVQILVGIASLLSALYVPRLLLARATSVVSDFHAETTRLASRVASAGATV